MTTYTYDGSNNVLTLKDALGKTTTWTYDTNSRPLTKTLPGGGVFSYAYASGYPSTTTDPNSVVTTFAYDADGRITSSQDGLGKTTSFTYDAVGNLITSTDPRGKDSHWTYDAQNRILSYTDRTGACTSFTYDGNGNLLTTKDALNHVTTLGYDTEDRLISSTDALGNTSSWSYDTAGRPTGATDGSGISVTYQFDQAGRRTGIVDAQSHTVTMAYDARNLVTSVTDPLLRQATFAFDDGGRQTGVTDPLSHTSSVGYDALNRVVASTGPGGLTASQEFDVDGNRTSYTDGNGHKATLAYDVGDRFSSLTTPEGRVTSYTYDGRNSLATVTSPAGHVTTYAYDDAKHLTSVTDDVGQITYTTDDMGRPLTETQGGVTLSRTYDALGRVTQFTDGAGNVIGYTYDAGGNLSQLTYPDGKTVTYTYDGAHRLKTVTDWASRVTTYTYDTVGRLTQITRPNGTTQVRQYDAASQLTSLVENGISGAIVYSGTYSYDNLGRLTGENVSTLPILGASSMSQTFDKDNRIATIGGSTAAYDADGNIVSAPISGTNSFTYDARNRLTAAGGLSYGYDCEGNRVSLTDSSGTTHFAVAALGGLPQVLVKNAPDGTVTRYVFGVGLSYEETGTACRYYHYNRRGDAVALTDDSGAILGQTSYDAYGSVVGTIGTMSTAFLADAIDGVMTDSNGLRYHRFRYFHPGLQLFLSEDSLLGGISGTLSLNRFAYCHGEPVNCTDASGHFANWLSRDQSIFGLVFDTSASCPQSDSIGQFLAGLFSCSELFPSYAVAKPAVRTQFVSLCSSSQGATWGDVLGMSGKWATGAAPAFQYFGPDTPQTKDMMNAPGVQRALDYFYAKNAGNAPDQQQPVTDYGVGFGLKGLWQAGTNPTQQFVGNYRVELYPNADGNISVQLTNTTSMTSFLYGLWPNSLNPPAGYPGGNYTQMYGWVVPNKNVPNPPRPPGSGASGSW